MGINGLLLYTVAGVQSEAQRCSIDIAWQQTLLGDYSCQVCVTVVVENTINVMASTSEAYSVISINHSEFDWDAVDELNPACHWLGPPYTTVIGISVNGFVIVQADGHKPL